MNKYKKGFLKLDLQHFGDKTLYEMKQNLATIGQQLQKTERELSQKAIDPSASMEDIQTLQKSKDDLKARFDVIKEQHDVLETEQKAKFAKEKVSFNGLDDEEKTVKAKAEFIRASVQGREMSQEAKALIAIPADNETGGDKLLPTTMTKEIVHEPFSRNQLREVANVTNIPGLEVPRIAYTLDDDDFITDKETAKEIEAKGDTVSYGRNKFKVKVKISDTVIHGSDLELVSFVDNALRSGLAAKERKDALAESPSETLKHMTFYNGDIHEVEGEDLYNAIVNALADLHEDFRDNAEIVMSYKDYTKIVKALSNGNTSFFDAPAEKVFGKPVVFTDAAIKPIVGDFNYFGINYDNIVYDSDKDVDSGNYLFVLTAWYDQQRTLDNAFRVAKVTP